MNANGWHMMDSSLIKRRGYSYEKDKDGELKNITLEQFNSSISLLSISVDNNYVEYWFDDNDIYGGHNIVISKKHEENEYNVNLAG